VLSTSAAAVLLACLLSSWGQAGYWRNSQTLFTHAINLNPDNYMAYHHLGMDLVNRGKLDQAIAMYQKTLALAPAYPSAYNNLAIAYARQGKFKEAIPLFKEAIRLTPGNISFYRNLALAYRQQGQKSEAEAVMEQVEWLSGTK
jgi:Flp pilus assembly protein TadD